MLEIQIDPPTPRRISYHLWWIHQGSGSLNGFSEVLWMRCSIKSSTCRWSKHLVADCLLTAFYVSFTLLRMQSSFYQRW